MNCQDIGSVLDQHRTISLTAAERSNVDTHLAGCERCAEQWFAHRALASERASGPRPGLFADIVAGARSANMEPARRKTAPWISGLGIAAAIALAAVTWWSLPQRGADAPRATDATGAVDPTAANRPAGLEPFRQGEHYVQLAAARPAPDGADGILVEEFFMYGCNHCYAFERQLEQWRATLPQNATLVPVPAIFNPIARLHARAFYTAEVLGKRELHAALYEELHRNNNPLDSESALEAFFGRFGVNGATFRAAFESPDVQVRLRRAEELNREYRISATPSLVVDREFLTSPSLAGSAEQMLAVADYLVARELERRRPSERRTSAPAF